MKPLCIAPLFLLCVALEAAELRYPVERVRQVRDDSHAPDVLYTQNRLIISHLRLEHGQDGMRLSGELLTDFDADRMPPGGRNFDPGQQPVNIGLELRHIDTLLRRESGVVRDPGISVARVDLLGPVIAQCNATADRCNGAYGLATFEFPRMEKPLAPGAYVLLASITLRAQPPKVQAAIKWCSDWYGHEPFNDPARGLVFRSVMAEAEVHDRVYDELMHRPGRIESSSVIYIGNTEGGLHAPGSKAANWAAFTPHYLVASQLLRDRHSLDQAAEIERQRIAGLERLDKPEAWSDEEWKAHVAQRTQAIKDETTVLIKNCKAAIARAGGDASALETGMVRELDAARGAVLEQMARFEEELALRYWKLEGWLLYEGWNAINTPGYNANTACAENDLHRLRTERIQNRPKNETKYFAELELKFAKSPPARRAAYFKWEKQRLWGDAWDADKFCKRKNNKVLLDAEKWAEHRLSFLRKYRDESDKALSRVTTTETWHNHVWPKALKAAQAARDCVMVLAFSYEYFIRTTHMQHSGGEVLKDWQAEAQRHPDLKLAAYHATAQGAPVNFKTQWDSHLKTMQLETGRAYIEYSYARSVSAKGK